MFPLHSGKLCHGLFLNSKPELHWYKIIKEVYSLIGFGEYSNWVLEYKRVLRTRTFLLSN